MNHLRRAMSSTTPTHYIFKIFPHSTIDTRFAFPIPIPASHEFFLTELDYKDGFVHFSTAKQVPGVLDRFYGRVEGVTVLRCETGRLGAFKRIRWEENGGQQFPHLYALLEGENVDSFRHMFQDPPGSGWKAALNKPNIESWLV